MGKPLKFKTVEELQTKVDEYFDKQEKENKPLTMSGLALSLDIDRKTLLNYSNREKYFPTIKKAREKVEEWVETKLYSNNVTGAIFNLKNNFDWKDKKELDLGNKDDKPLKVEITKSIDDIYGNGNTKNDTDS